MNSKIRAAIIFVVYTFLVFVFTVLFFIFFTNADTVLPPDAFAYKLSRGFIYFFNLIPAVLITSEIFGFSWFFGISSSGKERRFSNRMLIHLKTVLITCVSCVIICFIAKEVLIPIVQEKVFLYEGRARNYQEYTELAQEYSESGSVNNARFYAEEALKLYPDSEEAKGLALRMEREAVEAHSHERVDDFDTDDFVQVQDEELSYSYLTEAEKALAELDYINAHYYAEMAARTTGRDDQNLLRAKEISAESWNLLYSDTNMFNKEAGDLYKTKKEAYAALEHGDVLKAYYTLIKLKDAYPGDPDVVNYFNATVDRLEQQYFFVDETADLRDFEAANNVYFAVKKPDGQTDLIFIGGVSIVENTSQFIQYFRNFSVTTISKEGQITQFFSVPYAKMTAQLVSSLLESGQLSAGWEFKTSNDQYVPYIFLEGVDRQSDNTRNAIRPKFKYPQEEETQPFYLIDIPFGDLILIRQACSGPDTMPLLSLFRFVSKAAQYGFSGEVYSAALAKRGCYPLIILAVMIFAAVISFNYRLLSGHLFKFSWLLLFPIMTAAIHFFMMLTEYVESILSISLYSIMGTATPVGMLVISIGLVLVVSVRFLSVHGE